MDYKPTLENLWIRIPILLRVSGVVSFGVRSKATSDKLIRMGNPSAITQLVACVLEFAQCTGLQHQYAIFTREITHGTMQLATKFD